MLLKLITSNFRKHKARLGLTIAAVALSVSLVVSVTGGFATINQVAERFLVSIMGSTDAVVMRTSDPRAGIDESLVADLRADPDTQSVVGRLETEVHLLDEKGEPRPGRATQVVGIRRPEDTEVNRLNVKAGEWFAGGEGDYAVVDQVIAESMKVSVGDWITLPGPRGQLRLQIVGIVHKPGILASQMQTIYLPLGTLQRFVMPDHPGRVGRILVDLAPGVNAMAFEARWEKRLGGIDPGVSVKLTSTYREDLDKNLLGVHILSYAGGGVSMLTATFIVFSALSMGVTERQRTLAMLRAVGAFKSQIAKLVILEGLIIAGIGVAIGMPLGWLWLKILVSLPAFQAIFDGVGVTLSPGGLLLAGGGSIAAALLASLLPAWSATRVDPLDAMRPLASGKVGGVPIKPTIAGLVLICIDSFILFGPVNWITDRFSVSDPRLLESSVRFYAHFLLGLPSIFIGFFLLAPAFVWVLERTLGPVVAWVMRVRYPLLRQQLSAGIWRAAGSAAALMVGLAVLVVMQVQGHSALNAWKLPVNFPDVFIYSPTPLGPEDQKILAGTPGIREGELMPIAIASPGLGSNLFAIAGAMMLPNATMYFGVDPDLSLRMMELEFRDDEGRRVSEAERARMARQAAELLKQGRHVIVTDEFRQLRGLKRGDKLPLMTTQGKVDFTIAGIVWSPGMDVINSRFDLGRQFEQRTAASIFGSLEDARTYFGVKGIYLFAANLDYFKERDEVLKDVQSRLGRMNLVIGDVRQIKKMMQDGLGNLLLLVSTVAFAAMAVASLGVTNTVMASVRSRQWQFGVLRSIGVTRGQLLRLVIGEAALLGVVGVGLGLTLGLHMSINAKRLTVLTVGFNADMFVPWGIVLVGVATVLLISFLASLVPAMQVARAQPLDLLQAGRSAT